MRAPGLHKTGCRLNGGRDILPGCLLPMGTRFAATLILKPYRGMDLLHKHMYINHPWWHGLPVLSLRFMRMFTLTGLFVHSTVRSCQPLRFVDSTNARGPEYPVSVLLVPSESENSRWRRKTPLRWPASYPTAGPHSIGFHKICCSQNPQSLAVAPLLLRS